MDEVHGLPAKEIDKVFSSFRGKMKIGLTATPYRVIKLFFIFSARRQNQIDLL
jgi:superfamily II DNA or RNA helicase